MSELRYGLMHAGRALHLAGYLLAGCVLMTTTPGLAVVPFVLGTICGHTARQYARELAEEQAEREATPAGCRCDHCAR